MAGKRGRSCYLLAACLCLLGGDATAGAPVLLVADTPRSSAVAAICISLLIWVQRLRAAPALTHHAVPGSSAAVWEQAGAGTGPEGRSLCSLQLALLITTSPQMQGRCQVTFTDRAQTSPPHWAAHCLRGVCRGRAEGER